MLMSFSSFTIADSLIILATLCGPLLAVQAQKWIEKWREKQNRKTWIFYNLMATRASRTSERHVEALNSIQLEYHADTKGKGKRVKDAWAELHAHLHTPQRESEAEIVQWHQKANGLFTNLLYEMSQYLGYKYNRVDIENGGYNPIAIEDKQLLQNATLINLADLLAGHKPLKVEVSETDQK